MIRLPQCQVVVSSQNTVEAQPEPSLFLELHEDQLIKNAFQPNFSAYSSPDKDFTLVYNQHKHQPQSQLMAPITNDSNNVPFLSMMTSQSQPQQLSMVKEPVAMMPLQFMIGAQSREFPQAPLLDFGLSGTNVGQTMKHAQHNGVFYGQKEQPAFQQMHIKANIMPTNGLPSMASSQNQPTTVTFQHQELKYPFSYRSTNYRRDLVWRPLIRLFRRWLKKDALSIETYEGIREECITRQGYLFCKALGLSDELSNQRRSQMALLLMISSHRIIRRKRLNPLVTDMMQPFCNELWPVYYKIFNETSNKQRVRFFNETLVQVLWGKFLVANSDQILQYLSRVQTDYFFSPQVYHSFIEDIRMTEMSFNFRILP